MVAPMYSLIDAAPDLLEVARDLEATIDDQVSDTMVLPGEGWEIDPDQKLTVRITRRQFDALTAAICKAERPWTPPLEEAA